MVVKHEVDVNTVHSDGEPPLHMAAVMQQPGAIDVLVQAGADIEKVDDCSRTPLHAAAHSGSLPTVLTLLGHGARIDKTEDWLGGTPLHAAAAKAGIGTARMVDLLPRRGADEKAINNDSQTPSVVSSGPKSMITRPT